MWQVGVLRAGAWAARGLRVPARDALLADIVDPAVYGRAYGFERAMDNLGAIGGPILAIVLVPWSAPGERSACRSSRAYSPPRPSSTLSATPTPRRRGNEPGSASRSGPSSRGVCDRCSPVSAPSSSANRAATLLILRATKLLEPGRSHTTAATTALWLYVSYSAAAAVASIPAHLHADRTTPRRTLTIGVTAFGFAYAGLTHDTHGWLALTPWFIGIGCVEIAEHAAVAAYAPAEVRGSAFGLLATVQSFGNFAASGIAGLLWTAVGPTWAFAYLTGWMILAVILLTRMPARPAPAAIQLDGEAAA